MRPLARPPAKAPPPRAWTSLRRAAQVAAGDPAAPGTATPTGVRSPRHRSPPRKTTHHGARKPRRGAPACQRSRSPSGHPPGRTRTPRLCSGETRRRCAGRLWYPEAGTIVPPAAERARRAKQASLLFMIELRARRHTRRSGSGGVVVFHHCSNGLCCLYENRRAWPGHHPQRKEGAQEARSAKVEGGCKDSFAELGYTSVDRFIDDVRGR